VIWGFITRNHAQVVPVSTPARWAYAGRPLLPPPLTVAPGALGSTGEGNGRDCKRRSPSMRSRSLYVDFRLFGQVCDCRVQRSGRAPPADRGTGASKGYCRTAAIPPSSLRPRPPDPATSTRNEECSRAAGPERTVFTAGDCYKSRYFSDRRGKHSRNFRRHCTRRPVSSFPTTTNCSITLLLAVASNSQENRDPKRTC
jgi:hypothetical protein